MRVFARKNEKTRESRVLTWISSENFPVFSKKLLTFAVFSSIFMFNGLRAIIIVCADKSVNGGKNFG